MIPPAIKKTALFIYTGILFVSIASGQTKEAVVKLESQAAADSTEGAKIGGTAGVNFTQASFSNWAAGGENSIAVSSILSVFANYRKGNSAYDNMLDIGYGFLNQGKGGKLVKTDDKIDLTSKYGKKASKDWYYAVVLNFKTQMTPGYNYPNDSVKISDWLAPAYVLGAIGMDYRPDERFTAFIAPVTLKVTIVNNQTLADAGAFGVDPATYDLQGMLLSHGKMTRNEFGGYFRMVYRNTFFSDKSVSLLTKLELFSNYGQHPENIDISWESIIGFRVNKYISASITSHLLYDDDIMIAVDSNGDGQTDAEGPRIQFKEVIGIGLTYKF